MGHARTGKRPVALAHRPYPRLAWCTTVSKQFLLAFLSTNLQDLCLDQAKKRFCVEVDAADSVTLRTAGDKRWFAFVRKMVLPQILNIATISKSKVFLVQNNKLAGYIYFIGFVPVALSCGTQCRFFT